jgi:hypothetical protein
LALPQPPLLLGSEQQALRLAQLRQQALLPQTAQRQAQLREPLHLQLSLLALAEPQSSRQHLQLQALLLLLLLLPACCRPALQHLAYLLLQMLQPLMQLMERPQLQQHLLSECCRPAVPWAVLLLGLQEALRLMQMRKLLQPGTMRGRLAQCSHQLLLLLLLLCQVQASRYQQLPRLRQPSGQKQQALLLLEPLRLPLCSWLLHWQRVPLLLHQQHQVLLLVWLQPLTQQLPPSRLLLCASPFSWPFSWHFCWQAQHQHQHQHKL